MGAGAKFLGAKGGKAKPVSLVAAAAWKLRHWVHPERGTGWDMVAR
jgi:hypothetical protein